jgi:hypothetical protein
MKAALLLLLIVVAVAFVGGVALWTGILTPTLPEPVVAADPSIDGDPYPGFLYGRIETTDGSIYEGRLRWGGTEEAFWGNYFLGFKVENPWADQVPDGALSQNRSMSVLGIKLQRERKVNLDRPFMARFGDIVRVDRRGREVRVTLKSGTEVDLDLNAANDFDDGVRVWDATHGVVDVKGSRIRALELLPATGDAEAPYRLHGTVRAGDREFRGFVQWNRESSLGSDALVGHSDDGNVQLKFDEIRAIERRSDDGARVTLDDGRELDLFGTGDVDSGNRGIYVIDPRYGRVLVSWETFERVEFSDGGSGPVYDDFQAGSSLQGGVASRSGERYAGRLVFDLDESETTDTLDAPASGVNYTIPFGQIAAIVPGPPEQDVIVTLHGGDELRLEPSGDLAEGNGGMLILAEKGAEYVRWADVARVDFDPPK